MNKLSEIWTRWSEQGLRLPFLFDPTTQLPSITLALLYVTSILMLVSVVMLHIKSELLTATLTSIMVWILSYIMYRLRHIDKASFNLKDGSLSVEDVAENNK